MGQKMRVTAQVITNIDIYVDISEVDGLTSKYTSETLLQEDYILSTGKSVHISRIIDQEIKWETVEDENGDELDIDEFREAYLRELAKRDKKKDTKG